MALFVAVEFIGILHRSEGWCPSTVLYTIRLERPSPRWSTSMNLISLFSYLGFLGMQLKYDLMDLQLHLMSNYMETIYLIFTLGDSRGLESSEIFPALFLLHHML